MTDDPNFHVVHLTTTVEITTANGTGVELRTDRWKSQARLLGRGCWLDA